MESGALCQVQAACARTAVVGSRFPSSGGLCLVHGSRLPAPGSWLLDQSPSSFGPAWDGVGPPCSATLR